MSATDLGDGTTDRGPAPDGVRWLTEDQQQSWRAFLTGTARLLWALNRELEDQAGLSLSEYEILVRLSEAPGRTLRMSELADEVVHSRSRITHMIHRLEGVGLVRRMSYDKDRRGVNCVLTDTGFAALAAAAPGHVTGVRRHLVDVVGAERLAVLGTAMDEVSREIAG